MSSQRELKLKQTFLLDPTGEKRGAGVSTTDFKKMQRIVLEMFCQYEWSLPFRQLEPETNTSYYETVNK